MAASNFYKDLKALKLPIHKVFQQQHFSDLPQDWHVVISDVKIPQTNSNTKQIKWVLLSATVHQRSFEALAGPIKNEV